MPAPVPDPEPRMPRTRVLAVALLSIAAVAAPVLAGCGDDDDDAGASSTTEATATAVADAAPAELEMWQTDLNAVGCYAGAVDGSLGPETETAIREFQSAAGLEVDGLLGPETESALQAAVSAGETVCSSSGGTTTGTTTAGTTTSGGATTASSVSVVSANYDKSFTVTSCSFDAANEGLTLVGEADGIDLSIAVTEGAGTLAVDGGTEEDGITLNGNITSTGIGDDGSFDLSGTYGPPNDEGDGFEASGTCSS
jgi:hypothetical protein